MVDPSKGKIFLAGDRGHTETVWFRSYNTFNFGAYQREHKARFAGLYVLNDDTLAGSKNISLTVEEESLLFLLPVVGAIQYTDSAGNEFLIEASQCLLCPAAKETRLRISNPYEEELVNFIQAWFSLSINALTTAAHFSFNLNQAKNSLVKLNGTSDSQACFIGKFDGRAEGSLKPSSTGCRFFAFVIQGVFEVQNRLLESRDGLALWDVSEIEFEALSNEAILLLMELPDR